MKLAGTLSSCRCSRATISWWAVWFSLVIRVCWTHSRQEKGFHFNFFFFSLSFTVLIILSSTCFTNQLCFRIGLFANRNVFKSKITYNEISWNPCNSWARAKSCLLYVNIIVCSLLFQLVSELVRVATPGATIIILTWCHRDLSPSEESLKPEEKKPLKKICDAYYLKTCSLANYVQLFESFSLQVHIFIFQALLYWSCYTLPLFLNYHPLWFWINIKQVRNST